MGCSGPAQAADGHLRGLWGSESMMTGVKTGIIDAAVTVCDGAGSVITANADLVQGMGGYISDLPRPILYQRLSRASEPWMGMCSRPKTAG